VDEQTTSRLLRMADEAAASGVQVDVRAYHAAWASILAPPTRCDRSSPVRSADGVIMATDIHAMVDALREQEHKHPQRLVRFPPKPRSERSA
jgi:hypothetical protein